MNSAPLMIDLVGLSLSEQEKTQLTNKNVCGVILFSRNYQDKNQLKDLVIQIRQINADLLISTDHEGGRVQRFKAGFTHLPAMAKLGDLFLKNPDEAKKLAIACGYILAYELLEVGIDFSFAPVVDRDYDNNTVIGDRAFSNNPDTITTLAARLMQGMKSAGMCNVIKHFPGHGFVALDSHLELPVDTRMIIQMAHDMRIFKDLLPQADAVMPAHILYKKCDLTPAGFSSFWLKKMLRKKYQYQGVIISDDLHMQGAVNYEPNLHKRIDLALNAGCDMVLLCNQPEQTQQVIDENYPTSGRINALKAKPNLDKMHYQQYLQQIQPLL